MSLTMSMSIASADNDSIKINDKIAPFNPKPIYTTNIIRSPITKKIE